MNNRQTMVPSNCTWIALSGLTLVITLGGCTHSLEYRLLRHEGQKVMWQGAYGAACNLFHQAEELRPRRIGNLYDLGDCHVNLARRKFEQRNHAAALRELDMAISYFSQAIEVHPGNQAAIDGKGIALELKGQFDEALENAEWAAEFVGPSARQYTYLANELEERGDVDGALLRYRQAVTVEPTNPKAHRAFAGFLLRQNREEAAVYHLQAAYRLDPLNRWVIDKLADRSALPSLSPPSEPGP